MQATSSTEHVRVMDGLRGLAVTMVVLFHYWLLSFYTFPDGVLQAVQYAGFLGVELFFFISAFCLFLPYASGRAASLKHFYYRRAIKILPSYLLALLVFGFVFTSLFPSTWQHGKFADLGVHLLFLHNMISETHGSFDGVLWSLAVEVQFYVFFPFLAWLFLRQPVPTAALMIALSVAYRAWNRHEPGADLGLHADMLPAFLDLFAFGMLAAWLVAWMRRRPGAAYRVRVPLTVAALVAMVLLVLFFVWVDAVRTGPGQPGIWQSQNRPYLGALFLVIAITSAFALPQWRALLGNRILVFLSTISYNLYIWHQAVGLLLIKSGWWHAKTRIPTDDPHWRWTFMLLGIAVSILIATLLTYLFERPLLRDGVGGTLRRVMSRRRRTRGPVDALGVEAGS